ncbi:bifunctional diaminohydroxyphosphoribosylaminopyrimidine deaminase/5-amino-6-(5-phosphoribosylamino)uracil reductase RibD [Microbacterium sp. Au-Mic1]|uniref:bifunctional diaminohydroxyphosphoribosylaminopyrimidine deaminase/5-amino-6-(5-phosphoribosylamino)uracil reductase RibD n=1 Tax=Microbacterium sp. Au-Mic1 TaxID=2906457 RepID=UPI001E2F81A4|nr:bifunctional diaminohydroxyphosphoribosylaminopyrimidine deaminase/5-amino-6-(5-phosphoribosylamino)uracil reductase RibD [Microbacterium sp. Au-Mic1]MCE4025571.1 bifunctional diaminohydroxyphosphoribosylaminopyrimidine deaminase/5-amino-6-(5-phosphoribosylamino)uracil reductase RibD [Microbacterium sp. Au-Mic1]
MTATAVERAAMTHALDIARRGPRGLNPQVGAMILSPSGDVLAEGWHRGAGTPHAEVDALSKLTAAELSGATAVVTLEPCNHTGRTGPCAQALIDAGVARVVYALDDPGARSGGGAERMRAAGLDVVAGEQADAAEALIRDWLTVQRLGRPHVTVKWAQSLDGRAAAADGSSQWITGPAARADVHRRRAAADAIVVGTGTVLADDPALTARDGDDLLPHQPVPVVIGARETPAEAAVRRHPHAPLFYAGHDLAAILADLRDRGIQRVFVEGGPTLASAFLADGLMDEVLAYVAPVLLGGPKLALGDIGVDTIGRAQRLVVDQWLPLGPDLLAIARPAGTADDTAALALPADEYPSRNEGAV